ncbi:protein SIEVE ELEMENT OCCLUSION B-like isoform X2 [Solanum pennellii]|uniref:Protein SIEVE ELEMENT OCCLUSION B-like isoform X2 n=1 Tax=Solanum pennellii TaxID=28526 RepID=A0ABM1VA43_SOLPN|nr:protein SIEVE ELEMENT OCCLUSION B-like isoform X2 [Solanum pennellii]
MTSVNPLNEKVSMNNPMNNMSNGSAANRMQPMSNPTTGHHINPLNVQINPHSVVKPVSHDMIPASAVPAAHHTAPTNPRTSNLAARLPHRRGDHHMFLTSDDNAMMKHIEETHIPDGRDFDVKPLVHIIEDIVHRATPIAGHVHEAKVQAHLEALEEKAPQNELIEILNYLAYPIQRIKMELISKCANKEDAHSTTMSLLHSLTTYAWDTKVAITFAAFAQLYGEFGLLTHQYTTNPLAKSVAIIMELPEIMTRQDILKQKFDAIHDLIDKMLDVTKCIIEFRDVQSSQNQHVITQELEMLINTAHISTAAYWTMRAAVMCAAMILNLIAIGHEQISSTSEAWEISSLAHKLANILDHLKKVLNLCHQKIEEKRQYDKFEAILRLLRTPQLDNMKILSMLIHSMDDQLPLFDGTHKRRVSLDVLRRKHVLLLISDLDIAPEELFVLHHMYDESKTQPNRPESNYDVVWIPVVDKRVTPWTDAKQMKFEEVQASMPWYTVAHPSMIDPAVLRCIKEVWGFKKKPQLVVLDPQGKESNNNAYHILWIWGSLAFPFTKARETALWKEQTWNVELLADSIDQNIFTWISEGKCICLYGGEDIEWIRSFTSSTRAVANAARVPLEMLYVGKKNPKERVRKNSSIIQMENLSHVVQDQTLIWFFWERLESMWHSRTQQDIPGETDPILQEIVTILSYEGSDLGWAVFSRGLAEMTRGKGDLIVQVMKGFDRWRNEVSDITTFVPALDRQLRDLHSPHHCTRLILPSTSGHIPERVICAECSRPMEKFIMYRCCTD